MSWNQSSSGGRSGLWICVLLLGSTALACAASDPADPTPGPGATGGSGQQSGGSGGKASGGSGGSPSNSGGATGSGGVQGGSSGGSGGNNPGSGGAGSGGTTGSGGANPDAGGGNGGAGGGVADGGAGAGGGSNFSFFVVSMKALQELSGKTEGFGGDLRFGKPDGLAGADEICKQAAEKGLPGAGQKNWRALLSAMGANGPVHARDRIGKGPWYDRKGRLLAMNLTDLFGGTRPKGDAMLVEDLTNERGEPNHYVGAGGLTSRVVDNHDTLTGSDAQGMLSGSTCSDWTSTTGTGPLIGHSWPRSPSSGRHWLSDHRVPGCTPGLDRTLGGSGSGGCVGCSGGYGGFYCFVAN